MTVKRLSSIAMEHSFSVQPFYVGLEIEIHVIVTDNRATAKVVHVDPERLQLCGIALAKPENIWCLSLPPDGLV